MRCPKCNSLQTCCCASCVKHRGVLPTDIIRVGEDDEQCAWCGFTENMGFWADLEIEQARADGSWPGCEHNKEKEMSMLTFGTLREANVKRCEDVFHKLDSWSPTDWACALAGETGEACNFIKKLRRGDDVSLTDVGDELADIIIHADLLAARLDLDLGECVRRKFNEVSDKRKSTIKL